MCETDRKSARKNSSHHVYRRRRRYTMRPRAPTTPRGRGQTSEEGVGRVFVGCVEGSDVIARVPSGSKQSSGCTREETQRRRIPMQRGIGADTGRFHLVKQAESRMWARRDIGGAKRHRRNKSRLQYRNGTKKGHRTRLWECDTEAYQTPTANCADEWNLAAQLREFGGGRGAATTGTRGHASKIQSGCRQPETATEEAKQCERWRRGVSVVRRNGTATATALGIE
ncbi:hypothetical protein B0H17DRAFT_1135976 [Mycena rosella]|uniref:Uncharacterized protein n=1 Tax=Mycena rosella TaxID=1033263 RepID=A0AAD7DBS5_MYCRO|nr:hypothetical protein B0H17DRAFT_1135976 [Mycena rosella]